MKIICKLWLDNDGKVFGEGPYLLLKLIERTGSLHQATKEMGISYRKAWTMLQRSEEKLGVALIERKAGGQSGGGSKITPSGTEFMRRYEQFHAEALEALDGLYKKHFNDYNFQIPG